MTTEQKIALVKELRTNMELTKEQYLEICAIVDELGLEPYVEEPEDKEPSWEELFDQIDITNK